LALPLGARDDSVVVDYVYRRGGVVGLLAVAQEGWDWADARRCHLAVVWKGVSVSIYVYFGFVDCFVLGCPGFIVVFLSCRRLPWLFAYGVGLSLICYWFIGVAPVRGGTCFSLPPPQRK
jgi:hypothetical protein